MKLVESVVCLSLIKSYEKINKIVILSYTFSIDNMKGGLYLKRLREEKNLTQSQMGKLVGKRNERISEWESDVYAIKLIDFLEMAEKLGVKDFNKILKYK